MKMQLNIVLPTCVILVSELPLPAIILATQRHQVFVIWRKGQSFHVVLVKDKSAV